MSKLYRWYGSLGLATKQFLYLSIVTLALVMVLAGRNLHEAEGLLRNQVIRDAELLVSRTNQYIDANLDNVENMLLLLSTQPRLLQEGQEEVAFDMLRQFASNNNSIAKTLYLIRPDGKALTNAQVNYEIIGNPHLPELYELAMQNYGAINVSEPYYSPMSGQTLAYVLPVTDTAGQVRGVVAAEINLTALSERISPMIYQSYALFTRSGNVINRLDVLERLLPVREGEFPPVLQDRFREQLPELAVGISSLPGQDGKALVAVRSAPNRLGWSLAAFIEEAYFYQDLQRLNHNYRTAMLAWIVILLLSAYLLTRSFTRPIRRFVEKMDRLDDVQVVSRLPVTRNDEIGRLTRSYNAMLERIQTLLHKTLAAEESKKEYELKMLRSQIAPHFLFNTLACIGSLAKQQRTAEVRETIRSLVKLLSFSFDRQSEYVALSEELEGLRMYMQIQQVRYGEQYRYEEAIPEELMSCRVLKLTLQPLVENALFHGLTPQQGGLISITGEVSAQRLRLYVRDDGVGMDDAARRRLNDGTTGRADGCTEGGPAGETTPPPERTGSSGSGRFRFTGIGLRNVHERVRIHHGERYGLRIGSRPGVGTIVRVDIPFIAESEEQRGRQP
ncbi:two-component sensor histidine kinase [Paenibacillus sp. 598K]|uniref:sensor histidine kinase n=1 Tax=Paenibacillus sp. 598K TaxID=1117987 RepID=UPI000FF99B10|nr:sensor histidine kinase [Paenibacillus sp. 598K]GBF78218.1 two-component sensor histidine kinase [Paenibacillus sp. 598K]